MAVAYVQPGRRVNGDKLCGHCSPWTPRR